MRSFHIALVIGCSVFSINECAWAQSAEANGRIISSIESAPADWVDSWNNIINKRVELMTTAYQLGEADAIAVRDEFLQRLAPQLQFEREELAKTNALSEKFVLAGGSDESPEALELLEQFRKVGDDGPLSERFATSVVELRVSPDAVQDGRARYLELIAREAAIVAVADSDAEQMGTYNGDVAALAKSLPANQTAQGNPFPRGEKLPIIAPESVGKNDGEPTPSLPVQPKADAGEITATGATVQATAAALHNEPRTDLNQVTAAADALLADHSKPASAVAGSAKNGRTAKAAAASASSSGKARDRDGAVDVRKVESGVASNERGLSKPVPVTVEAIRLQAAPPLDDWDKYVDATCKRFEFSDAQVIKAQSILKDLRTRATAYRSSRNEDFSAAERIADAKAKADRKKELSTPIDAFFEELKQRLDNLATLEQRAKAATPATTGRK